MVVSGLQLLQMSSEKTLVLWVTGGIVLLCFSMDCYYDPFWKHIWKPLIYLRIMERDQFLFVAHVLSGTCGLVKYRCVSRLCERHTDGG